MKPIRLKRDDVVHTVHSGPTRVRLASGADPNQTTANPTGTGWPSCWVCTERRIKEIAEGKGAPGRGGFGEQTWVPVEGYGIVDQRPDEEALEASCTHGNPGGREYKETKVITMPRRWSEVKKRQKRASLVFFAPGDAVPLGGNVVLA